ncbi:MAG: 6-phosphofructokinase 1 [Vicingaceae bacterium]|jgi:6-phosphofructokinase 1
MKRIAVFTSGGDAPGMNACVRAVVRTALLHNIEVFGIIRAYAGMISGDFIPLDFNSVSNIIQRGGTILKSARCEEFRTVEGREKAAAQLKKFNIDGVIAIGGDGTFTGAQTFYKEHGIPFIGCPGTIDNDLFGTDNTIGYDTALNTVVEAVDKIRDTADAHDRLFFVEVMGRDAGFIALRSGIAVGADSVLIPETETFVDSLIKRLELGRSHHKTSSIIIVAEGDDGGGAYEVARKVKEKYNHYETKVTVLGHIQRGGSPSAADRVLASMLGKAAVEALLEGRKNEMAGVINRKVAFTSFEKAIKHHQKINKDLLHLAESLA